MNTLERNRYTDAWRAYGAAVGRPGAILAVSAHWHTNATAVTAMARPRTIQDFYGFSRTSSLSSTRLLARRRLPSSSQTPSKPRWVGLDRDSWGLDHGTWSVLACMAPWHLVGARLHGAMAPAGGWRVASSRLCAVRTRPPRRVAVLLGIVLATAVLGSATEARLSSTVTPAETNEAITSIRSGLEPAVFLTRLQSGGRFSAKHREANDREQVAFAALATVVALALGHVVMTSQPRQQPTRRVRRAWAQRAPPVHQHIQSLS